MKIDGKLAAQMMRAKLAREIKVFQTDEGIVPHLAVIIVGEDSASQIYVRNKVKQTQEVGMKSTEIKLPENTTESELLTYLATLNSDDLVHGILVQLPLPKHINESTITDAIVPHKDVDGFHAVNSGRLFNGENGSLQPCTPQGCIMLIKEHLGNDLAGKHAVVIGRSNIVGKPVALLLLHEHCTVSIVHSHTQNLPDMCRQADILVAAAGVPEFVQASWIKKGATVIDVGINRVFNDENNGVLVGDVDYANAYDICGAITPVPGGVGPMTIACLLKNTLTAAQLFAKSLRDNAQVA